jgi:phosphatidylinositol glycan class N
LLGLDTNGHAHRPFSKEYLDNIRLVDTGIQKVVQQLEDFYHHDGKTAYVMTADHGMTDRGNHGDGHPDNTRTPLIVWGAGVAKPKPQSFIHEDGLEKDWNITAVQRHDVEQGDIAPLMVIRHKVHK